MAFLLKPVDVTINYFAGYKEPQLNQIREDSRINFVRKLLTNFNLRFNDLKYDMNSPSNKLVSFSRFFNPAFLDVSIGLEEVSATLRNPTDMKQTEQLFGLLFELIEGIPIKLQRYIVQQQNTTKGDSVAFWQKLSPHIPDRFNNLIAGKGITYHLLFPDHNLASFITVSDSIIIERGIFLYVQLEFSPNKYDPYASFSLAREHYDFMLKELDLSISTEA